MKTFYYFLFVSFLMICSQQAFSQILVSGTILNQETGEPVPYAYIKKKNKRKGAITNEDGFFKLNCSEEDTLIVSFISFQKIELPIAYFQRNKTCYLKPSINELAKIDVFANFDFIYDLIDKARKKMKKIEAQPSKTYFSLESTTRGLPVELLECYYNADVDASGMKNVELKNGRIGMSQEAGNYYVSLNTTEVISDYRLLNKRENNLPDNPLQLSKKRMAKLYKLKLLAFVDGVYKVGFEAKRSNQPYFNAIIWVDKETEQFVKVELFKDGLKKHPFVEIDENHDMEVLNFYMSYTFSNDVQQSIEKIAFNYDLNYDNRNSVRLINTNGIFLFFEKNASFDLPYNSISNRRWSDYDKIVSQPYNEIFWNNNEVISPSKKSILYKEFFKKTGVLLNFNELSKHNDIFKNRIVEWSADRILIEQINADGNFNVSRKIAHLRYDMPIYFYNLDATIYLDRNKIGDSVFYFSKTLIDVENSFYHLEINKNTACIINSYFDLMEIERTLMMDILESKKWTKNQVDSIYAVSQIQLTTNLDRFFKDVDHGEDNMAVKRYAKIIKKNLGIDNILLVWPLDLVEKYRSAKNGTPKDVWIEPYNLGTALLCVGQYETALAALIESYDSGGSCDPWVVYNLGIAYIKLGNITLGCKYLTESKEMGEIIAAELASLCEKEEG